MTRFQKITESIDTLANTLVQMQGEHIEGIVEIASNEYCHKACKYRDEFDDMDGCDVLHRGGCPTDEDCLKWWLQQTV